MPAGDSIIPANLMEDSSFKRADKFKLSEFNLEEIRGWTIDRFYQIEVQVDFIITDYFKPENKYEFRRIILNSSIVTIGGKMKILRNIKSFDKKIIDKIQKISTIRNAFAHLPVSKSVKLKGNLENIEIEKVTSQMEIMTSNGELKRKDAKELVREFFDLNKEIREYLIGYKLTEG